MRRNSSANEGRNLEENNSRTSRAKITRPPGTQSLRTMKSAENIARLSSKIKNKIVDSQILQIPHIPSVSSSSLSPISNSQREKKENSLIQNFAFSLPSFLSPPKIVDQKARMEKIMERKCKDGKLLIQWFLKLTPEERGRALSFQDKSFVTIVRQMYKHKKEQGEGLFFAVEDPQAILELESITQSKVQDRFCFRKLANFNFCFYPERWSIYDSFLEDSIRLGDTREYLDTLTIASNLLEDEMAFINVMQVLTRGNFLLDPCKVNWIDKNWSWDTPNWFKKMGFHSLGTYIAQKLETVLWQKYWEANKLDPRSRTNYPKYPLSQNLEGLLSKSNLINFWRGMKLPERRNIVGSMGNILYQVLTNSEAAKGRNSNRNHSKMSMDLDYPKMLSALVDISTQEKSLDLLFDDSDLAQNEKAFIEVLYFSPLNRAELPLDLVLRRVGFSIQSAYSSKIYMDIIVSDEKERKKKNKKKVKKRANSTIETRNSSNSSREREKMERERLERERVEKERRIAEIVQEIVEKTLLSVKNRSRSLKKSSEPRPSLQRSHSSDFSSHSDHESFVPASSLSKRKNKGLQKKKKKNSNENQRKSTQDDIQLSHTSNSLYSPSSQSAPSSPTQKRRSTTMGTISHRASTGNLMARSYSSALHGTLTRPFMGPLASPSLPSKNPSSSSISGMIKSNSANSFSISNNNNNNSDTKKHEEVRESLRENSRLDREVHSFFEKTRMTIERDYRPKVVEMVRKITMMVTRLWEGATVEIYGSYATSLCIPSSDVDLVVFGANTNNSNTRYTPKNSIQLLAKQLGQSDWITSISIIETAKVPVIKLISDQSGISISADISFNEEVEGAPVYCSSEGLFTHCGIAARELIKSYVRKMPEIVPLALVLKQFLHEKSLNNAFRGGLSSYCLVLMLISFLQSYHKKNTEKNNENLKPNLGELLLQFLNLYGKSFDYDKMGVTIQNGGGHFELEKQFFVNPGSSFVIVDPFNPTNNLGLHAKGIWSVKAAFAYAHESLLQSPTHLFSLLGKLKERPSNKPKGSDLYDALNLASNANGHPNISQHLVQQKIQESSKKNEKSKLNSSTDNCKQRNSNYARHHMDVPGHTYSQKDTKSIRKES